mgnify:CR=1 FL=1
MNLYSQKTIKEIFLKHSIKPSKGLGQNFLINPKILEKIIITSDLSSEDTVLEVGPGIGTLTKELSRKVKKVITVEKDRNMVEILKETLGDCNNIEVIQDNALTFEPRNYKIEAGSYKVVANIPYYLTSPLIRKFLEEKKPPELMVLMIQKEVAKRICEKPPNMSLLAVSVQFYAEPKIISYVKKESFWPSPKVDSAIIKINNISNNKPELEPENFFRVVKAGFSQPRKQLANNLSKSLKINRDQTEKWLLKNNIKPAQRAETLSIKDWHNLSRTYQTLN